MVVGAGPVPARWPVRATFDVKNHAYIAPFGASGWHRACPYLGKKALDMGYIILNILISDNHFCGKLTNYLLFAKIAYTKTGFCIH